MEKKIYEVPAIVYEGELEVQAGSPLSSPGTDLLSPEAWLETH